MLISIDGGAIWTWGSNTYGELGRKKGNEPQQLKIKGLTAVNLSCGSDNTAIVTSKISGLNVFVDL